MTIPLIILLNLVQPAFVQQQAPSMDLPPIVKLLFIVAILGTALFVVFSVVLSLLFAKTNERQTNVKGSRRRGFTLIELAVVMAILGVIAALAVPRLLKASRAANQASAIQSLRTLTSAEATYRLADNRNAYGSLGALHDAKIIDEVLGGGGGPATNTSTKSGYIFQTTISAPDADGQPHYVLSAIPAATLPVVATGFNRYGSDESMLLYQDENNLETHYTTSASLKAGTSRVFQP